ncbi:glycine betaine transporter 1-like [Bolinopsis microptera]|uniref:glycine betaine transporter 1-like n=1 Tax=Bolinopsis microptera TaxID=2820187 RepID=UPI00307A8EEE
MQGSMSETNSTTTLPKEPHNPERRGTFVWQNAKTKDRNTWIKVKFGSGKYAPELRFNPIVSFSSILLVAGFVLWCIIDAKGAGESFVSAKTWITAKFTWLYIGSQDVWAIIIIIIYFSKYGKIKLGQDHEEPEYNDISWFTMLFACGVGVGLFFYGVAEPLYHYTSDNRYTTDSYSPDNQLAQQAINLTFYHWGIHGWVVYVVVGLLLGFVTFRKGMPMTMKSCFYPLIGDKIYSWPGDMIDILSVITTLFGVCTSLGLGVVQVNAGMNYINPNIEKSVTNQVIIIWCVTLIATISVVSGLGNGIRRISEVCFTVGMFVLLAIFFLGDPWFILNLFTQSIGYYFQWILQLGTHSDAFEMSVPSFGGKDRGRAYEDTSTDGPSSWMDGWTIFYWGWWISWSPFVGTFIAKISRGRTIRQFVNGALTAPVIYSFLWMVVFGGTGIQRERSAAGVGLCCPKWNPLVVNGTYEEEGRFVSEYGVRMEDIGRSLNGNWDILCEGAKCNPCAEKIIGWYLTRDNQSAILSAESHDTFTDLYKTLIATRGRFGQTSHDYAETRLSCFGIDDMWFALMYSFGDVGPFLSGFSMFAIVLYFVTSSDSGSLIIDIISANGDQEPPVLQRLFWALVEGATATALLAAGGTDSLKALQTASVITGLPYTILLCFMCVSLWRALAMELGDIDPFGPDFAFTVLDPFTSIKPRLWLDIIKEIVLTPVTLYRVMVELDSGAKYSGVLMCCVTVVTWLGFIILLLAEYTTEVTGMLALSLVFYFFFVSLVSSVRVSVRLDKGIIGNPVEDFFCCFLLYPVVAVQMTETVFGSDYRMT